MFCSAVQLTEDEKRVINRRFVYDGEEGQVEALCGRRKSKKTYEYEVKWVGRRENKNSWITREK
jgi:elongation factor 3